MILKNYQQTKINTLFCLNVWGVRIKCTGGKLSRFLKTLGNFFAKFAI